MDKELQCTMVQNQEESLYTNLTDESPIQGVNDLMPKRQSLSVFPRIHQPTIN